MPLAVFATKVDRRLNLLIIMAASQYVCRCGLLLPTK